ncbi:hypothetical protein CCR75_005336 [Bremia lactucae]|uniref:Vps53 N-terminal domain-containing protein n=1 Tax=Bremia lactucae TaxID=4779 RepID=A0A976ID37_BRELC|nr:hypothetical protein CCR75_005336 [Bremia lactucae]
MVRGDFKANDHSDDGTSAVGLQRKVKETLVQILPSEDALDRPEFDAREFINRNFPDEQSLEDIGGFVCRLRVRMKELDDLLSQASRSQSMAAHQTLVDLIEAKAASQQLFHKIQAIREKAEQSEAMVQETCRDIKQLDYAKRHLQTTLTALKRLHMLVNAVDQLEFMSSQRRYREAASLLEAVNQLFVHFDSYSSVIKIVELHETVRTLQEELGRQIFADFRSIGPISLLEENFPSYDERQAVFVNLSAACDVVDALGSVTREKLIRVFCDEQLMSYERLYGHGGECAGLQHAETRYAWFYKLLANIEDIINAFFPIHWRMARRMCIRYCEKTRTHLLAQIGALAPDEMDVTRLLKSLQRALMFERDAVRRFEETADEEDSPQYKIDENGEAVDPLPTVEITTNYRRKKCEVGQKALVEEMKKNCQLVDDNSRSLPTIRGMISCSFDPFMTAYISLERKNMEQMINEDMSAELVDWNGQLPVFSSSVNMFAYIRNSIKRCTALTNGQTFFDLHNEFKYCFRLYSQRLLSKLPPSASAGLSGGLEISSCNANNHLKLRDKQEDELCFVINTAEYCAETLPSLEEVIQTKINKAFFEAIELSEEVDTFHFVGAAAMKCIVAGLETSLERELAALYKTNWQVWETVDDESLYVTRMGEKLQVFVQRLRQMLSGLYFTNFCDKFTASFVPKILQAVLKCRKMNQVATQQLLLDVYALKTLFLQLPVLSQDGNHISSVSTTTITSRYTKFVTNEMATVENVLKLIGTPNDMLVESFKIMLPDGTAEDFQGIMVVKGLRKCEQSAYLEMLGMQCKPTGKIAEMEGKVSDMTENWRKNMQNLAKAPFAFTGSINANVL